MNRETNIEQFEELMSAIERPGIDKLMDYIRKSDFYTAPASTKFHLSCKGGLLQHSLNVYEAMKHRLKMEGDGLVYKVAGHIVAKIDEDSLKIVTLLHDLCKTNFYEEGTRNQKTYDKAKVANAQRWQIKEDSNGKFIWETVPTYAVNDKNPYGHGEKSVMMIEEFMKLSMEERYAIRWHMGMGDCTYNQIQAFNASCEKFPLVLLLHNADQEASHFLEATTGNKKYEEASGRIEFEEAEPIKR